MPIGGRTTLTSMVEGPSAGEGGDD
jgi:hypothetical protein